MLSSKLLSIGVALSVVLMPSVGLAAYVNLEGVNIQTTPGTIQVQQGGTVDTVNIQKTINGGTINVNGTNVQGQSSGTQNTITVNGTTVNILRDGSGRTLNVYGPNGSLNMQYEGTGFDQRTRTTVVNLEGNSTVMIKSDADLNAYNNLVIQERPGVKSITVNPRGLRVRFQRPGKFLGLLKMNVEGDAEVSDAGVVRVKLPWYSFLVTGDVKNVESNIQVAITNGGSQGLDVSILGNGSSNSVTLQGKAKVLNVVTSAVNGDTSVNFNGRQIIIRQ